MKLLMIYADRFGYTTSMKTLENIPDIDESKFYEKAIVGFIQIEKNDERDLSYIKTKLVKNLKWAAGKNNTRIIILHSFAHLSESKADSEITRELFDDVESRLAKSDYEVYQTPFGYFLNLDLKAPGTPLARLFKDIQVD